MSRRTRGSPGEQGSGRLEPEGRLWRGRYVLYLIGVGFMFVGFKGIVHNTNHWENPTYYAKLFIGVALFHDLVWVLLVAVVGGLLARFVPLPARRFLQLGLASSAVIFVMFYPALRNYGNDKTNPSVDPLNYAHGLLIALGVVWGLVAVCALAYTRAVRRRARAGAGNPTS